MLWGGGGGGRGGGGGEEEEEEERERKVRERGKTCMHFSHTDAAVKGSQKYGGSREPDLKIVALTRREVDSTW